MKIDAGAATLIGAALAFLGAVAGTALAQWGAAKLEDRRARTEIVLEMMRSNDREQMVRKLQILTTSGLLPDEDGRLRQAISQAPVTAFKFQEVKVPVLVRCFDPAKIPAELPPIGKIPEEAGRALNVAVARALELKNQNETMRRVLHACNDKLPAADEVFGPALGESQQQRPAPESKSAGERR